MNDARTLVANFAKRLGYTNLSPEEELLVAEKLGPTFLMGLIATVEPLLPEDAKEEARGYLQKQDLVGLFTLLEKKIPNFHSYVEELFVK